VNGSRASREGRFLLGEPEGQVHIQLIAALRTNAFEAIHLTSPGVCPATPITMLPVRRRAASAGSVSSPLLPRASAFRFAASFQPHGFSFPDYDVGCSFGRADGFGGGAPSCLLSSRFPAALARCAAFRFLAARWKVCSLFAIGAPPELSSGTCRACPLPPAEHARPKVGCPPERGLPSETTASCTVLHDRSVCVSGST
jgi:hypothetical protein